ncbi:MAG: gluconeogenesis factor YvcK family protein [Armatimonadota bacterium]
MTHPPRPKHPRLSWLRPGIQIKRWFIGAFIGVGIAFLGLQILLESLLPLRSNLLHFTTEQMSRNMGIGLGTFLLLAGLAICLLMMRALVRTVAYAIDPIAAQNLAITINSKSRLKSGARVVVVGGGTGLSTMLRGLKQYTSNITAIVTVTDDGGSSGRLVEEFHVLPPGDIRNCLVALADAEPTMQELFQYRFTSPPGLEGHSFGNLLIVAMTAITGDFENAIQKTSKVLAIKGRVLPSTLHQVRLLARMADGSEVEGETNIVAHPSAIRQLELKPRDVLPPEEAIQAILEADVVVLGPGSVYTSVLPNLLVDSIARAIHRSSALKVYVCNVMTQPGETDRFSASDHVRAFKDHTDLKVIDYVLVNTTRPAADVLNRYASTGAEFVEPDADRIRELGVKVVLGDFINENTIVRHDADKLAAAIARLARERRS